MWCIWHSGIKKEDLKNFKSLSFVLTWDSFHSTFVSLESCLPSLLSKTSSNDNSTVSLDGPFLWFMVENLFLIHNLNFLCSNLRPLLLVLSKVDTENRLFLSSLLLCSAYQSVLFYIPSSNFFSSNPIFSSEVVFSRTLLILLVLFCNFSYKYHFIVIQC